jgi:hypothetical protein
MHKEQERLSLESKIVDGLAISLINQAKTLACMEKVLEAVPLAERAYQLTIVHGLARLATQIEPVLYEILAAVNGGQEEQS